MDLDQTAPARAALDHGVTARTDRFLKETNPPTPFIIIDLEVVRARYRALHTLLPTAQILYAVKANPSAPVIAALAALGASFDLASPGEIERCRSLGIAAARLSFGNTIKKEADIAAAHAEGIGLFAFDSAVELDKLTRAAPGAQVFCRLLVENKGSQWPLSRKFGCTHDLAVELLLHAKEQGLNPVGVSFHVGSQQMEPLQWARAIHSAARIFRDCAHRGLALDMLNVGGGLPAQYRTPIPPLAAYTETIESALATEFGAARPRIIVEPGRYIAGDAGLMRTSVVLITRKSAHATRRWVYVDAGRYNGLAETMDERIQYRLRSPHDGAADGPVILAGPSCDSSDVLYQRTGYRLPLALAVGDPIDFLSAGAYTASCAAVEFNGFPPIPIHCI